MLTLNELSTYETIIKKSRFIARAARSDDSESAVAFVQTERENNATHNCWAYRIGGKYRFSDDGEPGGTAGRPILAAIDGQGLDCVVVVVTRYFGGIKLGTGGLVRAYGGATAECLRRAGRVDVKPREKIVVRIPFEALGAVYSLIDKFGATKDGEEYGAEGVVLRLSVAADYVAAMRQAVRDATRGAGVFV